MRRDIMNLKTVIKLLLLSLFLSGQTLSLAFDLTNNHYAAIQTVLKGKELYFDEFDNPFTETIRLNKWYNAEFLSEQLAPLLTNDSTSFFFYAKDLNENSLEIEIEDYRLNSEDIEITYLDNFGNQLQLIQLKCPNQKLKANTQAKIEVKTDYSNGLIFTNYISNHIIVLPPHRISNSEDTKMVELFLEIHCVQDINNVMMIFGPDSLKMDIERGYQLKKIELAEQDYLRNNEVKFYIDGHYYDSEFYDNRINSNTEITIIPKVKGSSFTEYNEQYSIELETGYDVDKLKQFNGEFISLANHQINYSIDPKSKHYAKNIGFLQDRNTFEYSQTIYDSPSPNREELNMMLDFDVKYLGLFENNRFNSDKTPYIFEDDQRQLLVYKQYGTANISRLEKDLSLHLKDLENSNYKFDQSLLFMSIENVDELEQLNQYVDHWNTSNQYPKLSVNHFQKFAKLFKLRNGIKLNKTDKIESPYYSNIPDLANDSSNHWVDILTNSTQNEKTLSSNNIRIVNTGSSKYTGILNFKHGNSNFISAEFSNGVKIPIQYDLNKKEYALFINQFPAFYISQIKLSESKSKVKTKFKTHLKHHKNTGYINWQFKGDKLSYKKEPLLIPYLKSKDGNVELDFKKGKLIQKGILFDSYKYILSKDNAIKMELILKVFKHKTKIEYQILSNKLKAKESIHFRFNTNIAPKSYSIDRYLTKENGYNKNGNFNLLYSEESVFMLNKTKLVFNSPYHLKWEYNHEVFNPYRTGFEKSSTDPTRLFLFIDGLLDQQDDKTMSREKVYSFSVWLGEEKDELKENNQKPILLNNINGIKSRDKLISLNNSNIQIRNVHSTDEKGYVILELKNNSSKAEKLGIEPYRKKSIVYYCNFSGKKTGIVKGKIKFEPLELKTIRIRL